MLPCVSDCMEYEETINPEHYKPHGVLTTEPIVLMWRCMTEEAYRGYLMGNIFKYISRYDLKNGMEDLQKAKKYIEFLEADLEGNSPLSKQRRED